MTSEAGRWQIKMKLCIDNGIGIPIMYFSEIVSFFGLVLLLFATLIIFFGYFGHDWWNYMIGAPVCIYEPVFGGDTCVYS